jgi:glycosyltransferase involved in cell wall biosynthesis
VASRVGITPDIIQHNVNGLLANSMEQWFDWLKLLVDHTDIRARLTQAARQTIEASYSLQVWGPKLVALFRGVLSPECAASLHETVTVNS